MSFGAPIAAFVGVVLGHVLLRMGANELDVWRRREETMRMLRWASELAASVSEPRSRMGVAALDALSTSELLQPPVDEFEQAGKDVEVIEVDATSQD